MTRGYSSAALACMFRHLQGGSVVGAVAVAGLGPELVLVGAEVADVLVHDGLARQLARLVRELGVAQEELVAGGV